MTPSAPPCARWAATVAIRGTATSSVSLGTDRRAREKPCVIQPLDCQEDIAYDINPSNPSFMKWIMQSPLPSVLTCAWFSHLGDTNIVSSSEGFKGKVGQSHQHLSGDGLRNGFG